MNFSEIQGTGSYVVDNLRLGTYEYTSLIEIKVIQFYDDMIKFRVLGEEGSHWIYRSQIKGTVKHKL